MNEIDVSAAISIAAGWLEVEDEVNGYELGATSFGDRTLTIKNRKVGDDRVDLKGTLTIASAPGNVTETLEVIVSADDPFAFDTRVQALTDALTQLTFQFRRTIGNSRQIWDCFACEQIQVVTSQPYIAATLGQVIAQVPRLPDITLEEVG